MLAHDLAKCLLDGPNVPVAIDGGGMAGYLNGIEEVVDDVLQLFGTTDQEAVVIIEATEEMVWEEID